MGNFTLKISDRLKSPDERLSPKLLLLKKSQYWLNEEIEKYQRNKLRNLIDHAYRNVPYYHSVFKNACVLPADIQTAEDLRKLPALTKDILRGNLDQLTAPELKHRAIPYRTGGSTGEPMRFFIENSMLAWSSAARYRAWSWCDFNFGDKCAMLWGASFDLNKSKSLKGKLKNIVKRNIIFNAFELSDEKMASYAKDMASFKPKVIRSYSSAMYTFARFVKENDIRGIEPISIITTAENLYPHQRKLIEEVFGCNVYDGYGSRETSLIAHECEARNGYHISDENSIVEFLDKNGEPVAPGESGEIVITDFHNMVMPWIRYKIGDLGTPTDEKCSCGRTLSMMKSIDGRVHDIFVTPDGRRVPGEFFPHLFKDVDGIKEYQLVQKSKDRIVVSIVKSPKFTESHVQYLLQHMKEYLGEDVEIEFVYPDKIDWPESGKRRFTISEIRD